MSLDLGELVGRARLDAREFRAGLRDLDQVMAQAPRGWEASMRRGGDRAGQAGGQGITRGVRDGARDSERAVADGARAWRATTERAGQQAGRAGGDALGDGVQDGARRTDRVIAQAASGWRAPAERAGDEAGSAAGQSMADSIAERLEGVKDKIGSILSGDLGAAGFGVAGAAIGGALVVGISDALAQNNLTAELTAQLGLTKEQSANVGKAAGTLFANGYGDGLEQIGESVGAVIRNIEGLRDASADVLSTVTGQAMTASRVMGDEVGATTRAVGQMIRTGMVKDATEGFDLLTAGAQKGANAAEDLSDTFIEYGTQFRKVGIDGTTAMGLLSQGMKAGARDADIVADAIKEFSIRAIDGSDSTAEAFEALGLAGDEMTSKIAAGGPEARAGLDQVLDGLRKIPDPAERSRIATALFGTQAEDLGDALGALDLDTAAQGMGSVAGAADKANAAFNNTPQAKVSSFFRMVRQEGVNALGLLVDKANAAASSLSGVAITAKDAGSAAGGMWDSIPGPARDAATAIGAVMLANRLFGDRIQSTQARLGGYTTALRTASTAQGAIVRTASGQAVQMGRFGSSIQSLGTHIPTIQRMQGAFVNAAAGAERFPRAAGAAAASMSLMRSAGSGLLGAIGGPFGAALIAGGVALMAWQRHQQDAARAAAESKARVQELTSTIDKNTFSTTAATRAAIAKSLSDKGVYDNARKYGLDISTLTDAIMGNKDALALVNGELDASNLAYRQHAAEAANDGTQVQANDKANRALKDTINGLAGETRGSIQAAKDQAAAMKTGAAAAQEAKTKGTEYGRAMDDLKGASAAAEAAQKNLRTAVQQLLGTVMQGDASLDAYKASIDGISKSITENGKSLNANTEAGRNNRAAVRSLVNDGAAWLTHLIDTKAPMAEQVAQYNDMRRQLQSTASQFGLTGKAAEDFVNHYLGNVPKSVETAVKAHTTEAKKAVAALGYDYDTLPKEVQTKVLEVGAPGVKDALAAVGLAARNIPGQTTTVTSVPEALASTALLSQLRNVAFEVDGKTVTVTSFAPQSAAVTQALKNIRGAQLTADGKSVTVPTGAPNSALTRLLLDNITGAAYNADTKSVSVPTSAPGAINATRQIDGVTSAAFRVPPSKHTSLNATDNASGKANNVTRAVGNIPSSKTVWIDVYQRAFGGGFTLSGTASANGNILDSAGRVTQFANGGFSGRRENHQAQIAPAGAWRLWAEPETGGEAYIPLSPAKRARSMQILAKTADLMGAQVVARANGGIDGGLPVTMSPTIINGPDLARWERVADRIERAVTRIPAATRAGIEGREREQANTARLGSRMA